MALAFRKGINATAVVIGLSLFAYGYYLDQRSSVNKQDDTLAKQIITHEAPKDIPISTTDKQHPAEPITTESPASKLPKKLELPEYQELVRWDNDRGYMSGEDYNLYLSYSEQTLKDLSNAGDVKAMLVLGSYYIQKDDKPEESAAQFHKAAVYGATTAFANLASKAQIDALSGETDKTPEGREQVVIEVMALFKVAAMRGDFKGSTANINAFKEVHKVRYKQPLEMNPDQLDKIDLRAKEIYDELQQERYKLGLGDFDNSTPEVLKKSLSKS